MGLVLLGIAKHLQTKGKLVDTRQRHGTLTSVGIHELSIGAAYVYASGVLLDKLDDLVNVAQRQIIVLKKTLGCSVRILCNRVSQRMERHTLNDTPTANIIR